MPGSWFLTFIILTMHISDLTAYSDNAWLFFGKGPAEQSHGNVVHRLRNSPPEPAAGDPQADFMSPDSYKGNFIDIYV